MKGLVISVDARTGKRTERMAEVPCVNEKEGMALDIIRRCEEARAERNRRLAESDWTMMPDAPVDRKAWKSYRQALRDVPGQAGFPDVDWPEAPRS